MSGELCVILSYLIVHHVLTFQANVPLYPYTAHCKYVLQTHIMQMYLGERAILCIVSIHHVGTHHANVPLHTGHCFSNLLQPSCHAHAILRPSYYLCKMISFCKPVRGTFQCAGTNVAVPSA